MIRIVFFSQDCLIFRCTAAAVKMRTDIFGTVYDDEREPYMSTGLITIGNESPAKSGVRKIF